MSYGSWLVVTWLSIAPYYAILELLFGIPECFTMSGYCTMLCNSWIDKLIKNHNDMTDMTDWPDIVSSREYYFYYFSNVDNRQDHIRNCEMIKLWNIFG